jgi:hypothetical protein
LQKGLKKNSKVYFVTTGFLPAVSFLVVSIFMAAESTFGATAAESTFGVTTAAESVVAGAAAGSEPLLQATRADESTMAAMIALKEFFTCWLVMLNDL